LTLCSPKFLFVIVEYLALLSISVQAKNNYFQSSAFNHEYGSWAAEPKARTPTVRVRVESDFFHDHKILNIKTLHFAIENIFSSLVIQLPSLLTIFSEQRPLKFNDHGKTILLVCKF
jgi:hypothetical protein